MFLKLVLLILEKKNSYITLLFQCSMEEKYNNFHIIHIHILLHILFIIPINKRLLLIILLIYFFSKLRSNA